MTIETTELDESKPFSVMAEFALGFDESAIKELAITHSTGKITFNEEEAQELVNVLAGKKCLQVFFSRKGDYSPHKVLRATKPADFEHSVLSAITE